MAWTGCSPTAVSTKSPCCRGFPKGRWRCTRAGLVLGADFRVQAQAYRVVGGIVYISLHCRTEQGTFMDYDVASIAVDLLRSRADGKFDIDILAASGAPSAEGRPTAPPVD